MEDAVETERDDSESSDQHRHHQSENLLSFDMENDNEHHHDIYYCPTSELEVVVPPFSLFHYDTDHSYISTTSSNSNHNNHDHGTVTVENPYSKSSKNNNCITQGGPGTTIVSGLAVDEEFQELFDLYPYDVMQQQNNHDEIEMGIGLQEQVIEISQNTRDYEVERNSYPNNPSSNGVVCNDNKKSSLDKISPILSSSKVQRGVTVESPLEICDLEVGDDDDDEECSSESEMEQQDIKLPKNNFRSKKEENKNKNRKIHKSESQNNHHHVGQFPQTYIHLTSERRLRFCFGLQTIVSKVKALISRTGASADLRVWFEGHVFTLDNAEVKIYEFSNKSNKKILNGFVCGGTIIPTTSNSKETTNTDTQLIRNNDSKTNSSKNMTNGNQEVEDDHRYAATILTQTESSQSVRDHQYNEVNDTQNNKIGKTCIAKSNKGSLIEKTYIKTRYARERWLRNSIKTLYTKMQRLINRTGARITLCVKYQGIMITQKNYKDLEIILGKPRPQLKKYPTDIVKTKENPEAGTIMRISIPGESNQKQIAMNSSNKSLKIEFLKIDKTMSGLNHSNDLNDIHKSKNISKKVSDPFLQSVITSDHDYLECTSNNNSHNSSSSKNFTESPSRNSKETEYKCYDFNNLNNNCQMSPSFCHAITSTSVVNSNTEEILIPTNNDNLNNTSLVYTTNTEVQTLNTIRNNIPSKNDIVTMNVDACTSMEHFCQICGGKNIVKEGCTEKYPLWIRCSHPLCSYLVHPRCLGFLVMNSQQLQFLPPFFCPAHRSNIIIID